MPSPARLGLSLLWILSTISLGCTNETESASAPDKLIRNHFPASAQALIDAPPPASAQIETTAKGLRVATPGHVEMLVPVEVNDALRIRQDNFEIRVREEGRSGPATLHTGAVMYGRRGGSSLWRPTPQGCEEWLMLEDGTGRGDEPVVTWHVEGAFVAQDGDFVVLRDEMGTHHLTVSAPLAYTRRGMPIGLRLEARADAIALYADPIDEPVMIDPVWTNVAPLASATSDHIGITLIGGRVLVAGDSVRGEVYNEATNTWTQTFPLVTTHSDGAGARLNNGRVLLTGGINHGNDAEIFDPGINTWSAVPPMLGARVQHTAVTLTDGRVLVAGGYSTPGTTVNTAEIYNPAANSWSMTSPMAMARYAHSAVRLINGMVLVIGGVGGSGVGNSAELYNPATGTWSLTGPMATYHYGNGQAVLLANGKVLMMGGNVTVGDSGLYDPTTNTWTSAGSHTNPRIFISAALLLDGKIRRISGIR